ncbi:NAD-dependent epimerase dehydratase [Lactobacillus selangorensis]|uniref:NAD-dependent epimerase dehydratase n=1 Tax=Lactobacillus selangorensis TaxID=81857 RepID=A0A0R2FJ96_9LACO|nr:NAD(P)H-binding protein [Lactobacillus selangorensis]KRN28691.1 NAD-dependent epimerase dehydratase [Lactobacillus selangorensis]KRN32898.1 NAD-dependent epimerase dehydratase [Lactobacillus selangorensis]
MKAMILGAAGQIGRMVTDDVLAQSDLDLVLYGRNVTTRLADKASDRVTLVDGTFEENDKIKQNLSDVDMVYISYVATPDIMQSLIDDMDATGVKRLIALSIPDIYQEVTGPFQAWYRQHTGLTWQSDRAESAKILEASDLDYVLLRVTWLYNQEGNTKIEVSKKGEPFKDAQITREAVAQFVTDLLDGKEDYHRESLGVGEPGTEWSKPSFY